MDFEIIEVSNEDVLLRRLIHNDPNYIKEDFTACSLGFKPRKNKGENSISVDIDRLTSFSKSIKDSSKYRLFSIVTSEVRSIGLDCIHSPLTDNYAHAEIVGNINNGNASKLARASVYINYPEE